MKQKKEKTFTILIAALMLLTMVTQPTRSWGQSDVYTSNVSLTASGGSNASTAKVKLSSSGTEYDAIKLGTSSAAGYAYITVPAGTTTLYVHCAGWNGDGNSRTLSLTTNAQGVTISPANMSLTNDSGVKSSSPFTLNTPANATTSYFATFTLSGVNSNTQIKLATSSKRAVYWGVNAIVTRTITFNGNGGTTNTSATSYTQIVVNNTATNLTPNQFTYSGYNFNGWKDGSDNSYTDGQSVTLTADLTLTAQWLSAGNYITVSPTTSTPTCAAQDVEFSIDTDQTLDDDPTQFYTTSTGDVTASKPAWIGDILYDDGELVVEVKQNKTSSARTAYFRVESATVQSDVITITQSAFTLPAPSFDPESGTVIINSDYVLLESDTTGATIYYTMGATPADPTTSSTVYDPEEGIAVDASTTIKAIAVKYNISSAVATASYTVVNPLTTMDAIFTAATTAGSTAADTYITLGNWVVSGVSTDGKTAYVTDDSGKGFITYYGSGHGFAAGNVLSNTVHADLKLYKGAAEFTNLTTSTSGIGVTTGGTVSAITNKTIADLSGVCTGGVYTLNGLTYNLSTQLLSDGVNTIKPFNQLYSGMSFANGETYNVTGVYCQFDETKEILPRSSADIVVAPGVTASVTSISNFTYNVGGGPDVKSFTVSGANLTNDLTVTATGNYKVCKTSDGTYASSVSYEPSTGTVASTTVYVRLDSGLSSDTYEGTVTVASTGAVSKVVNLTGTVTYVIAYDGSLPTGCSVSSEPNGAQVAGESVSLTATAGSGYKFSAWDVYKTGESSTKVTVTDNAFTMPSYGVTVSATFVPAYTVTYAANGGSGTMTDENSPYIEGAQVTLLSNTFTYAGHTFNSWSVKDASQNTVAVSEGKFTMPASNVTVTAQWTTNTHDITMPSADTYGTYTTASTSAVPYGTEVTLTYTPESGYEHYVAVWSVNGTPIVGNTFNMPDEDVTVTVATHATWTVTYDANGGTGSMSDSNSPYDNGANVTVLANGFTYINHTFVKWNTQANGEGTDYLPGATISGISANVTLFAQWENGSHVTYTVTSTSSVSTSGSAPLGSSATYSSTYGTIYQLTNGNSMTLTLKGFAGQIVKKLTLKMHSNGSGGSGNMNMNIGETSYASISTAAFNTSSWNSAYTTSWVDIQRNASPNNHVVEAGEDIVITIAATANSLFCQSFTIDYETSSDPMVFAVPTEQTVNHTAQSITSGDKVFELYSLNIDSPTFTLAYCDEDGTVLGSNPYSSWFTAAVTDNEKVTYSVTANTGGDRKAYFKVYATVAGNPVYSALCSVTQMHQPYTYTLVDGSTVKIEAGKHYIIASGTSGTVYAMGYQKSNNRDAVGVTFTESKINETEDVYEFVISGDNTNKWTIYDIINSKYLYASSSSSNNLNIQGTNDNNGTWAISITEGVASIVAQGTNSRKYMRYNNSSKLFSCYGSSTDQSDIYLYVRDGDKSFEFYSPTTLASATIASDELYTVKNGQSLTVTGTLTNSGDEDNLIIEDGGQLICSNTVAGTVKQAMPEFSGTWGTSASNGWKFISSPCSDATIASFVSNAGSDGYDLYKWDGSAASPWVNKKHHDGSVGSADNTFGTTFATKVGYLAAYESATNFDFVGTLNANGTVAYTLGYTGSGLADIYLLGNPLPRDMEWSKFTKTNVNTYRAVVNSDGTFSYTNSGSIPVGEGFMVQTTAASPVLSYNPAAKAGEVENDEIRISVSGESGSDNAVVVLNATEYDRFIRLSSLNDEAPAVYTRADGTPYAVYGYTEHVQSVPLCFKAVVGGTYTISLQSEHNGMALKDMKTGVTTNINGSGSYTFAASPEDAETRFKIMLSPTAIEEQGSDMFVYMSGNNMIVNETGVVQVIDILGRVLVSRKVEGSATISLGNLNKGAYIVRLSNDSVVRTQKVIVK